MGGSWPSRRGSFWPRSGLHEVKQVHLMAAHADGSWYVRDAFGLDGAYAGQSGSARLGRTR
jgi:hypothetical protein